MALVESGGFLDRDVEPKGFQVSDVPADGFSV
jgi:hypothetical protein